MYKRQGLHYWWAVRVQVSFEEATIAHARRQALRQSARREGRLRERAPSKPVSYTHLDVYKRQLIDYGCWKTGGVQPTRKALARAVAVYFIHQRRHVLGIHVG